MTAAHWAAWNGNAEVVRQLVNAGAPLEPQNMYGGTVLDCCVYGANHNDYPYRNIAGNGEASVEAYVCTKCGYFEEYAVAFPSQFGPRPTDEQVARLLEGLGATMIVVGHTKVE